MTGAEMVGLDAPAPAFPTVWLVLGAVCTIGGYLTFAWQQRRVAPHDPPRRPRSNTSETTFPQW